MATPAEVANDLDAQSKRFARTQFPCVSKSCARGAETIRHLMEKVVLLEEAAEAEALAFERYRNCEDLHAQD
ncbi:hypothetical protein rosmuc_03044 [Roseovarius mucosus DSM 17069]|uniref:Uncharacterized protein n=1 Tax=Roseovarius mucosus DSM 17069 TaxID=1288298 RepID=A0A0A0HIJ1_9RHOB|nr:hypothetical protein [Roseovarius mucosus]KGM86751.1 hypothetical protein rosmuc_03044 [Roseovarius mucosus DSM 17069]